MHSTEMPSSAADGTRLAYKVPDAATQIGLSERQMWRLVSSGEIASFKIGGSRRVTRQALLDFVARHSAAA